MSAQPSEEKKTPTLKDFGHGLWNMASPWLGYKGLSAFNDKMSEYLAPGKVNYIKPEHKSLWEKLLKFGEGKGYRYAYSDTPAFGHNNKGDKFVTGIWPAENGTSKAWDNDDLRWKTRYTHPMGAAAHEMGHAAQSPKFMQAAMSSGRLATHPLSLAGYLNTNEDAGSIISKIQSAAWAPLMANEIDASWKGYNILKNLDTNKTLSRGARLTPFAGLPTYALGMSSPLLIHEFRKRFGGYSEKPQV